MMKVAFGILIVCILFLTASRFSYAVNQSLVISTPTPSIDYTLPYPGLLPSHPLYFMKNLRDRILLAMTRDPLKKSEYLLLFSDKHLAMGKVLLKDKKKELAGETLIKGERYLLSSLDRLSESKGRGIFPPGYIQKIGLSAKKHQEVITNLIFQVSDPASLDKLKEALLINSKASVKASQLGVPQK